MAVIRQDGSLPTKYGLTLDVETRYSDFKANLSDLCGIPTQNLILVNIIQSQFRVRVKGVVEPVRLSFSLIDSRPFLRKSKSSRL